MPIASSELIINDDGSIYHLGLKPDDLSETIITVGDPDRVDMVSRHFDSIELTVSRREFKTVTGSYKGKRLTVISTGIGTDNIDIVLNELDALVNIDFRSKKPKPESTTLNFIRLGTSGTLQSDIPINSILISLQAIGLDGLGHWYERDEKSIAFAKAILKALPENLLPHSYLAKASKKLISAFSKTETWVTGTTLTCAGFYAPQGRTLRAAPMVKNFIHDMASLEITDGQRVTNLEMETAGIYLLAEILGHEAISISAILANRANGEFSETPEATIEKLIVESLEIIVSL